MGPKFPSMTMSVRTPERQTAWLGIDSVHGRYMFGTDSKEIPDGVVLPKQTANIIEKAWVPFKAERLFVHRSCAADFLIRAVFVGCVRGGGAVNDEPIIAEPFAVDYDALASVKWVDVDGKKPIKISVDKRALEFLGAPFALPSVLPGMEISFQVENIGREPRRFLGAFLGKGLW